MIVPKHLSLKQLKRLEVGRGHSACLIWTKQKRFIPGQHLFQRPDCPLSAFNGDPLKVVPHFAIDEDLGAAFQF